MDTIYQSKGTELTGKELKDFLVTIPDEVLTKSVIVADTTTFDAIELEINQNKNVIRIGKFVSDRWGVV